MDTVELVGRVIIALAVVVGLIYLIGKKARGGARRKLRTAKLIDVLGRQSLSRNSSLAVVRIAGRALIVGVTDQNVRMLGEIELDEVAAQLAAADPTARRAGVDPTIHDASLTATIPVDAADLDGTLTAADIDAIRSRRPAAAGDVIPDDAAPRRTLTRTAVAPKTAGPLGGSALSPATWRQTLDALRELTVRKG